MCFAYTALHGLKEGNEVYGLIDAVGDILWMYINMVSRECYKPELFPLFWSP
jgi:hypothetical protein